MIKNTTTRYWQLFMLLVCAAISTNAAIAQTIDPSIDEQVAVCMVELEFDYFPASSCLGPDAQRVEQGAQFDILGHIALTDDVDAVFHCGGVDEAARTFGGRRGLELIIHNRKSGKTCFFRATNREGSISTPEERMPVDFPTLTAPHPTDPNRDFWRVGPDGFFSFSQDCFACHTAGGPYLMSQFSVNAMATFGLINDGHNTTFELPETVPFGDANYQIINANIERGKVQNEFLTTREPIGCNNSCHHLTRNDPNIAGIGSDIVGDLSKGLEDSNLMPPYNDENNPFRWLNVDSLDNGEDRETFADARTQYSRLLQVCDAPGELEAHAVGSPYNFSTANTLPDELEIFNLREGLKCVDNQQADGKCNDYKTRYLCPLPNKIDYQWSTWYDVDDPGSTMDDETRQTLINRNLPICSGAKAIEASTTQNGITFSAYGANDRLAEFNPYGLKCKNSDQVAGGKCSNYVVRYKNCGAPPQIEIHRIVNVWSGQRLTASSWDNNTEIRAQSPSHTWPSQSWGLEPVEGTPYVRIKNMYSNLYLNVEKDEEYSRVLSYYYQESWGSQLWIVEPVAGSNQIRLRNEWTNRYLTVNDQSSNASVRAQAFHRDWSSQRWTWQ